MDFGTCFAKIRLADGTRQVVETRALARSSHPIHLATGHLARGRAAHVENELVALARGALALVEEESFSVVDVGARDVKSCTFKGRRLEGLDWNQACGANLGFTAELLLRYYDIDPGHLSPPPRALSVTCGVLGLERVFDRVARGDDPGEVVASFIAGLARNVYRFAGSPSKVFLSGGMCENRPFLQSLNQLCDLEPLGRFVLVEGLMSTKETP